MLLDSSARLADASALRARLDEDGYLFLRNLVDLELIHEIQELIAAELSRLDVIDPDVDRSVHRLPARKGVDLYAVLDGLSRQRLNAFARQEALLSVFRRIFGEDPKPLDYAWPRAAGPGRCERPHCDWVYMCRGTRRLLSAWIPLMDLPVTSGPLMILENSHIENTHTSAYLNTDVDRLGFFSGARLKHSALARGGRYSERPDKTREDFGTRWLTRDYLMGDIVIFSTRCLHATLDNQTAGFRASIDLRFQPKSEPADPRFDGENPVGHAHRNRTIFDYMPVSHARRILLSVRRAARKAAQLGGTPSSTNTVEPPIGE